MQPSHRAVTATASAMSSRIFAPSKSVFWPAVLSAMYPLIVSGLIWPTSFTPTASCFRYSFQSSIMSAPSRGNGVLQVSWSIRGVSRAFQRSEHFLRHERHRAQPHADCIAYRVRDRRRHDRRRRLADAPRFFRWTIDQVDVDIGDLGKCQDRIARPVDAGHARAVERDSLFQHPAYRLQNVALDLVLHPVRLMICP